MLKAGEQQLEGFCFSAALRYSPPLKVCTVPKPSGAVAVKGDFPSSSLGSSSPGPKTGNCRAQFVSHVFCASFVQGPLHTWLHWLLASQAPSEPSPQNPFQAFSIREAHHRSCLSPRNWASFRQLLFPFLLSLQILCTV